MSNVKVKICGLKTMEDISYVNEVKPEYVGFVFANSKRMITPSMAEMMRKRLDPSIIPVGVFVDEPADNVIRILERGVVEIAQLHGNETEEDIEKIQQATGKEVIKAVQVKSADDIKRWQNSKADYLLLDSGKGSGVVLDWSIIEEMHGPFFLAGGLNSDNVKEAVERVHPYAVDVSSGVETEGRKDERKIRAFLEKVRQGIS